MCKRVASEIFHGWDHMIHRIYALIGNYVQYRIVPNSWVIEVGNPNAPHCAVVPTRRPIYCGSIQVRIVCMVAGQALEFGVC